MDVQQRIAGLYEKDTRAAYANLLALEALSEEGESLLPHLPEFIAMLQNERYVLRVRGFRLLCLQGRWDEAGLIDAHIGDILRALGDEKPTAVRQALRYLGFLAAAKPGLRGEIAEAAKAIDPARFKDTMAPLIMKDVQQLLRGMEAPR